MKQKCIQHPPTNNKKKNIHDFTSRKPAKALFKAEAEDFDTMSADHGQIRVAILPQPELVVVLDSKFDFFQSVDKLQYFEKMLYNL